MSTNRLEFLFTCVRTSANLLTHSTCDFCLLETRVFTEGYEYQIKVSSDLIQTTLSDTARFVSYRVVRLSIVAILYTFDCHQFIIEVILVSQSVPNLERILAGTIKFSGLLEDTSARRIIVARTQPAVLREFPDLNGTQAETPK